MTIDEIKEQKKENVKNGLLNFLEEYQLSQDNPNSFNRHSNNCGNQARTIGEAFSKYIILDSDIDDETQKRNTLNGTLGDIGRRIIRQNNRYIEDDRDWNRIKLSIERILDIGNNASHDNDNPTSELDLEAIKNALLYLGEYLFGQEFIERITSNNQTNFSNTTLDNSLEDIEDSEIEIKLGEDTTLKNSVKNIKNSTIKIG